MRKSFLLLICVSITGSAFGMERTPTFEDLNEKIKEIDETAQRVSLQARELSNEFNQVFKDELETLIRRYNNRETPEEYKKELLKEIKNIRKMLQISE